MEKYRGFLAFMLPGLYVFLAVPVDLINTNYYELDRQIPLFFVFFVLITLWTVIGYWIIFKKSLYSIQYQYVFLSIFALFFTFDVLTPTTLTELTGDEEQGLVREPIKYLLVESNVLFLLAVIYLIFNNLKKFISFAYLTFSFFLIIFSTQTSLVFFSKIMDSDVSQSKIVTEVSAKNLPNIYHIVLDAYSSNAFIKTIQMDNFEYGFNDFIFYEKNRSNYEHSNMSTASFMQGKMFSHAGTVEDFIYDGKNNTYLNQLKSLGYRISFYGHGRSWAPEISDYVISAQELAPPSRWFSAQELIVLDFWILRLSPTFLQKKVYSDSQGIASKILSSSSIDQLNSEDRRTYDGKLLLEKMIFDERDRKSQGEVVFIHSYITHGPYIFSENCDLKVTQDDNYYFDQVRCTNSVLNNFTSNLKELKNYYNSLIIIHSDHGTWEIGNTEYNLNENDLDLLASTNLRGQPGQYVDNQTRALLLVKFPSENGDLSQEFKVSNDLAQLFDVAPTIMFEVERKLADSEGSPLQLGILETRNQKVSMGFKQLISDNETVSMGDENPQLDFIEYVITSGSNYEYKGKRLAIWK